MRISPRTSLYIKVIPFFLVINTQKTDEQINYCQLQIDEETIQLSDLTLLLNNGHPPLASTFRQEPAGFKEKLEGQKVNKFFTCEEEDGKMPRVRSFRFISCAMQ